MVVVKKKRVMVRLQGKEQKVLTIPKDININPDDIVEFLEDDKGDVKIRKVA